MKFLNEHMKKIILLGLLLLLPAAYASTWENLWLRPDQQAAKLLVRGKPKLAAEKFHNAAWKGVASYRAGEYQQAVDLYAKQPTSLADYNRGNALAHLGQFQRAIQAYNDALKKDPTNKDAKFNRDLLEKYLQQQKQQNQTQKQNNQQQDKSGQKSQQKASKSQEPQQSKKTQGEQQKRQQTSKEQNSQQQNKTPSEQKKQQQATSKDQQDQFKSRVKNNGEKESPEKKVSQNYVNQVLRQIPDDPGGLLRQKFMRDYERMRYGN